MNRTKWTRLIAAVGVLTVLAIQAGGIPGGNHPDNLEWLYSDFIRTPLAAQRDGLCVQRYGAEHTCVEWCDVYHGAIVNTNNFCCEDDGNDSCSKPLF